MLKQPHSSCFRDVIPPHTSECVAGDEQNGLPCARYLQTLVRRGRDLMVQVVKIARLLKGARLTTDITLPSVTLFYARRVTRWRFPARHRKRSNLWRLKRWWRNTATNRAGLLSIRTAAEGVCEEGSRLTPLSQARLDESHGRKSVPQTRATRCTYGERWRWRSALLRAVADAQLDRIRVDSRLTYESLLEFTAEATSRK